MLRIIARRAPLSVPRSKILGARRPASSTVPPPPDLPPPPPPKPNYVLPVFATAFLGGCVWVALADPDEEDSLSKVPKFLEGIRPEEVPPREG